LNHATSRLWARTGRIINTIFIDKIPQDIVVPAYVLFLFSLIVAMLIWFVIGAFAGLIYGKINSKNN